MTKETKTTALPTTSSNVPEKLSKAQLVAQVAEAAQLRGKDAADVVTAALDVMVNALKAGQSVGLPGLGTLSVKTTAARSGVKPGTAEKIQIPAGKKVSFKVATDLKQALKD